MKGVALGKLNNYTINRHERKLEADCVAWFRQEIPTTMALISKSLNGEYMSVGQRNNAVKSGMLVGDTDLTIYTCFGKAIKIELKKPPIKTISSKTGKIITSKEGGKTSTAQKFIHKTLRAFGFEVHVVDNLEDFKKIVQKALF